MQGSGPWDLEDIGAAIGAAAERIVPHRRKMTVADAEDIVRAEFKRRGIPANRGLVRGHAKFLHRGPWWSRRHPIQAHREGIRFSWRWKD